MRSALPWLALLGIAGIASVALTGIGLAVALSSPSKGVDPVYAFTIAGAYPIPLATAARLVEVARAVGTHPYWLADLIHYESGGSWSSSKRNPQPPHAVGLIQFLPSTARRLGTTDQALSELSALEQLDWVERYLLTVELGEWPDDPRPVPLDTLQALAMSVYHPPSRTSDPDQPHPPTPRGARPAGTPGEYLRDMLRFGGKLTPLTGATTT